MDSRYIYLEIGTTGKSAGSRGGNPGKSVEMGGPGVYGGGRSGGLGIYTWEIRGKIVCATPTSSGRCGPCGGATVWLI